MTSKCAAVARCWLLLPLCADDVLQGDWLAGLTESEWIGLVVVLVYSDRRGLFYTFQHSSTISVAASPPLWKNNNTSTWQWVHRRVNDVYYIVAEETLALENKCILDGGVLGKESPGVIFIFCINHWRVFQKRGALDIFLDWCTFVVCHRSSSSSSVLYLSGTSPPLEQHGEETKVDGGGSLDLMARERRCWIAIRQ